MKKTSIGGQAVIEGIMMKGPHKTALAVRIPDGSIDIEYITEKHLKDKCFKASHNTRSCKLCFLYDTGL